MDERTKGSISPGTSIMDVMAKYFLNKSEIPEKKCLNCGYETQPKDGRFVKPRECPRCHIKYAIIKDESRTSERFSLEGGVIYDSELGLQWAPCSGPGMGMSHLKAEKYARNLSLAGGGWRLPTREELKSLYDTTKRGGADHIFNINGSDVWSSELTFLWGMEAWFFDFTHGCEDRGLRAVLFNNGNEFGSHQRPRVLAVRSRQKEKQDLAMWPRRPSPEKNSSSRTSGRFNLEGGVIYDSELGLQWAPCSGMGMSHLKAEKYARKLSLAGGGWRLPTREELKSLCDTAWPGGADPVFNINGSDVWSSELTFLWGMGAWFFEFNAGYEDRCLRVLPKGVVRVLAVRSRR